MTERQEGLRIKKLAETHAETCRIASVLRLWISALSFLFAIGAIIGAVADLRYLDVPCSTLVLLLLAVEIPVFGLSHWKEESSKALEFESLANRAGGLADGSSLHTLAQLVAEQQELGLPNYPVHIANIAATRIGKRWNQRQSEVPIFDSQQGADEGTFDSFGVKRWKDKVGEVGDAGTGNVSYDHSVVNINRTNVVGKMRLKLVEYWYEGQKRSVLPSDPLLVRRRLLVKFEAKVPNGPHKVTIRIKLPEAPPHNGQWIYWKDFDITNHDWQKFSCKADFSPAADIVVVVDEVIMGDQVSSVQLRNILIRQV